MEPENEAPEDSDRKWPSRIRLRLNETSHGVLMRALAGCSSDSAIGYEMALLATLGAAVTMPKISQSAATLPQRTWPNRVRLPLDAALHGSLMRVLRPLDVVGMSYELARLSNAGVLALAALEAGDAVLVWKQEGKVPQPAGEEAATGAPGSTLSSLPIEDRSSRKALRKQFAFDALAESKQMLTTPASVRT